MELVGLPSWFQRAPKHPGEIKWGKFKADEWKSFCTVNLPITLGRLWGSRPISDDKYRMFENFMHLITAVKIATMHTINLSDIALYDRHMKLYLSGLLELYPFINLTPYQHLALHFSEHLRRFGPTHSWRCFAFERYNGILQEIPSNYKFGKCQVSNAYKMYSEVSIYINQGQMEESKFLRFCRIQNLRAIFSQMNLPPELRSVVSFYQKRFHIQGTLFEDDHILEEDNIPLRPGKKSEADKYYIKILQEWISSPLSSTKSKFAFSKATILPWIDRNGKRFQPGNGGNGHVLFQNPGALEPSYMPGCIFSIISLPERSQGNNNKAEVYVLLKKFQILSAKDTLQDTYRRIPHGGYLVYKDHAPDYTVVPIADIVTHFAFISRNISGIERQCIHILPLPP